VDVRTPSTTSSSGAEDASSSGDSLPPDDGASVSGSTWLPLELFELEGALSEAYSQWAASAGEDLRRAVVRLLDRSPVWPPEVAPPTRAGQAASSSGPAAAAVAQAEPRSFRPSGAGLAAAGAQGGAADSSVELGRMLQVQALVRVWMTQAVAHSCFTVRSQLSFAIDAGVPRVERGEGPVESFVGAGKAGRLGASLRGHGPRHQRSGGVRRAHLPAGRDQCLGPGEVSGGGLGVR
jgi:hypothetical protein